MQDGFGKACGRSFIDFVTPNLPVIPPNRPKAAGSVPAAQNRAPGCCFDAFCSRAAGAGAAVFPAVARTQVNQPMGGIGASGTGAYHGQWGFNTLSKLKPVFYRSPLNRLADLYPPYGGKIARLEKLLRFMS